MSVERMRFSEPAAATVATSQPSLGGRSGCYLSTTSAILLALLTVCLTIGVGLVVYFASLGPGHECTCLFPSDNGPAVGEHAQEQLWLKCLNVSISRNECLSAPHCPGMAGLERPRPTVAPLVKDVRLPEDLYPVHYEVRLRANMMYGDEPEQFTFNGSVTILMHCVKPTNVIIVHMHQLTLENSTISVRHAHRGGHAPAWTHYGEDENRQFFKLYLDGHLKSGDEYILAMTFHGPLDDGLAGFYRSSYEEGNVTRWLATTQFQPTDARRAFPCFDEPAIKATFDITLERQSHMKTLSNMPLDHSELLPGGWIADHFEKTVKMSTYLLAFVVCDFDYKERMTKNGVRFRVWARREAIDQVNFALDMGVKLLEFFEFYFNISFPLPKQDMIAIPDFAAGAMENWGLITYRETALLYHPQQSSLANQQHVAIVVSHELAHQWFGNLVTPTWWDDLWLNEGFATFVEYIGVDRVKPEFMMMDQFITTEVQGVFGTDGLGTSHPIYIPVFNPVEINEIFDKISYSKGASVIRMMNYFLGENTFRTGLTKYLRRNQYSAADHTDLWHALQEQAELDGIQVDMTDTMNTWIKQMGYPVVTVTRSAERNDTAQVSQKHFLLEPDQPPSSKYPSPYDYKWVVPFTYTTSDNPNWQNPVRVWMNYGDVSLSGISTRAQWMVANIDQQGFFRVNYDDRNWQRLVTQLKTAHIVIPVRNRAQIVDDAFALGRSGEIDQLVGMQVTEYLDREEEYLPWSAATDHLAYISNMMQQSDAYGLYRKYILGLIKPTYLRLGWNNRPQDSHLDKYLRLIGITYACEYGFKHCLDTAHEMYKNWMRNPEHNSIHPDLRSTVYCNAVRQGEQEEWNFAFSQYKGGNLAAEKSKLLYAMSCTEHPWLLSRFLGKLFDQTQIRKQDVRTVVAYVSRNPIGRYLAWDFVRGEWDRIKVLIDGGFYDMGALVLGLTASFSTEFELQQVVQLLQDVDQPTGTRSFLQAIEKIKANVHWRQKNEAKVTLWLQQLLGETLH